MLPPNFNTKIIPLLQNPKAQDFQRRGINTSIPTISASLGGFEKGELVIITAAPGAGKTQLARTFSLDFIEQGLNVLYLSFELRYNQLLGLFIMAGLNNLDSRLLILSPEDHLENDITFVEEIADKNNIDILVVDDLHSLEEKYAQFRRFNDPQALVLRGLSQRLKNIALKKNIVVLSMVHQRKDSIDNKDSSLSEIAYSGGIAQVADTVLSIKTDKKNGNAIIEIIKARWSGSKIKAICKDVNKRFVELTENEKNGQLTPAEVTDKFRRYTPDEL